MRERTPFAGIALFVVVNVLVVVFSVVAIANDQPEPTAAVGGLRFATARPSVAIPRVTTDARRSVSPTQSTPEPTTRGVPSGPAETPPETSTAVALQTETLVAEPWQDSGGTVRVHVVVSTTNDTNEVRLLSSAEPMFRLTSRDGSTLQTGRFSYAFPFVLLPGATSYLVTTVLVPFGSHTKGLRIETEVLAKVTAATQPLLDVTDLRLVSTDGRPGVSGVVHNTLGTDVVAGVVAVIGRDASGRVRGGWYDNVNVARISSGDEVTFQTEYPGLPPEAFEDVVDLSGVAFDAGDESRLR